MKLLAVEKYSWIAADRSRLRTKLYELSLMSNRLNQNGYLWSAAIGGL